MTHTAIVFREIRAANHAMDLLRMRQLSTRWAVGIVGFLLLLEGLGVPLLRHAGFLLFVLMAGALVTISARACVGLVADERHEGTLDLLFLAGVKSWELFVGKLLGAVLIVSTAVMGSVPLLAFPFLCGGLSFETFGGMLILLVALLLAVVGVSLLASTLAREVSEAQTSLIVIGTVWMFGLPVIHWMGRLVTGMAPFREGWLALSPFHTAMLLESGLGATSRVSFWRGTTVLAVTGLSALSAASLLLRHVWKRNLDSAHTSAPRHHASNAHVFLSDERPPLEAEMERNTRRLRLHWWVVGLAFGLWLLGAVMWGRPWLSPVVALSVSLLLATITEALVPLPLIDRVTALRRNGGLEMLLVTPLCSDAVVDGFALGTSHLLRRWKRRMACLIGIILFAGVLAHHWNPGSVFTYVVASAALLYWTATDPTSRLYGSFRIAAFTGDPRLAHLQQGTWIGQVAFGQLWNAFQFYRTLRGMGRLPDFPTGSTLELVITSAAVVTIIVFGAVARKQRESIRQIAIDELRRLASQPLPSRKDPRLKKWKVNLPVPTD